MPPPIHLPNLISISFYAFAIDGSALVFNYSVYLAINVGRAVVHNHAVGVGAKISIVALVCNTLRHLFACCVVALHYTCNANIEWGGNGNHNVAELLQSAFEQNGRLHSHKFGCLPLPPSLKIGADSWMDNAVNPFKFSLFGKNALGQKLAVEFVADIRFSTVSLCN